jgi:DNA-binding CsgD family transcriptional regulator
MIEAPSIGFVSRVLSPTPRHVESVSGDSVLDHTALARLWQALKNGTSRVVETFSTPGRMGIVVTTPLAPRARPVAPESWALLEALLVAARQKSVGFDHGLAASSVNRRLKQALAAMGVDCLPSRLPLMLVVAAHLAHTPGSALSVRVGRQPAGDLLYETFTLHEPSAWLAQRLAPAQCRVASLWIEGKAHDEIASITGVAERTVANHLAAIYRKLSVSGRLELLRHLSMEYALGRVPSRDSVLAAPAMSKESTDCLATR